MNDPFRQASWNTDQALICVASDGADVESIVAASDPRLRSAVTPIRQADRLAWLMYPLDKGQRVAIEDRLLEYLWSGQLQVRDDSGLIEPAWFDGAYIEIDVGLRTYFQRVARDPSDITETAEGSRLKTYAIEERQPRFDPGQLRDVLIGSNHASREANRTPNVLPSQLIGPHQQVAPVNVGGKRMLAIHGLKRAYPDGVPEHEPSGLLVEKVAAALEEDGSLIRPGGKKLSVSRDTILRAAERYAK